MIYWLINPLRLTWSNEGRRVICWQLVEEASTDYTARVIPHYSGVAVPLEAAHILWQQ